MGLGRFFEFPNADLRIHRRRCFAPSEFDWSANGGEVQQGHVEFVVLMSCNE